MMYRITLAVSLIALSASLSTTASLPAMSPTRESTPQPVGPSTAPPIGPTPGRLIPRTVFPKRESAVKLYRDELTGETYATGRIVVKFRDEFRFRAPLAPIDRPVSDVEPSAADEVAMILARHGATISQWINRTPEQLRAIEERAAAHSGRAQPDLAGMLAVSFATMPEDGDLEAAARELQSLISVEFAKLEYFPRSRNVPPAPVELGSKLVPEKSVPIVKLEEASPIDAAAGEIDGCTKAPACCGAVCAVDPGCCSALWDQDCDSVAASIPACRSQETPQVEPLLACTTVAATPDWTDRQEYLTKATANPATSPWSGKTAYAGEGLALTELRNFQQSLFDNYQLGPINEAGATIQIGVIDYSAYVNHEDFTAKTAPTCEEPDQWELLDQRKVIPEPNQTILLNIGADNNPNHGTAALGIMVAAKQTPNFGVQGIAYNAQGWFFPLASLEEGFRAQNAILSCFERFGPGDVLSISWAPEGNPGTTLVSDENYNILIRIGSDLGITTVCQAGEGSIEILPQPVDSLAIVVGSSTSGKARAIPGCGGPCAADWQRGYDSNFSEQDGEGLGDVDVASWGQFVATTGTWTNLQPVPGPPPPPAPAAGTTTGIVGLNTPTQPANNQLETNNLRSYTQLFGGTGAATPIIAASIAVLQATSKQAFGGACLAPEVMRSIVRSWGEIQCTSCMLSDPPQPRPLDCCQCGADQCSDEPNLVGKIVPDLEECAIAIFTNDFSEGNPTNIKLITGFTVNGGGASAAFIRAPDGNYLRLGTEQRSLGTQVDGLYYLLTGPTTDLYARIESGLTDPNQLSALGLRIQGRCTASFAIVGGFIYNYVSSRWDFIGVDIYTPTSQGRPINMLIPGYALENYFNSSGVFKARVWTCGLGLSGPHQVWHDLIYLGVNDPTMIPPGP